MAASKKNYKQYLEDLREEEKKVVAAIRGGIPFPEFMKREVGSKRAYKVDDMMESFRKHYEDRVLNEPFMYGSYTRHPRMVLQPTATLSWMPLKNASQRWHPSITPKENAGGFHLTAPHRWRPEQRSPEQEPPLRAFLLERIKTMARDNRRYAQTLAKQGFMTSDIEKLERLSTEDLSKLVVGYSDDGQFRLLLNSRGRPRLAPDSEAELYDLAKNGVLKDSENIYGLLTTFASHLTKKRARAES